MYVCVCVCVCVCEMERKAETAVYFSGSTTFSSACVADKITPPPFLLQVDVCRTCGLLISPIMTPSAADAKANDTCVESTPARLCFSQAEHTPRRPPDPSGCAQVHSSHDCPTRSVSCRGMTCRICGDDASDIVKIEVPYVFRYLLAELLSMNVKVSLDVKPAT